MVFADGSVLAGLDVRDWPSQGTFQATQSLLLSPLLMVTEIGAAAPETEMHQSGLPLQRAAQPARSVAAVWSGSDSGCCEVLLNDLEQLDSSECEAEQWLFRHSCGQRV